MARRDAMLVGALILATVAAGVALVGAPAGPLRALVTLPLALLWPGYALTAALFPDPSVLGSAERAAATVALSLTASILGGLLLHLTPWGVQAGTWALWLGVLTWAGTVVALMRRLELPAGPAERWRLRVPGWMPVLGLAAALGVAAVAIAVTGMGTSQGGPFTQLWILPDTVDGAPAVRLGLLNGEGVETSYRLEFLIDDAAVAEWPADGLAPGEASEWVVLLPGDGALGELRAELYLEQAPDAVYRHVYLRSLGAGSR